MLDEQHPPAVPSIPQTALTESAHTPSARPAPPNEHPSPLRRPEVRGMQALAHLYAQWPALPGLACTVHPHGGVVAQVPLEITTTEADVTFRSWANILVRDAGAMFREVERYDGPWCWLELVAEIPVDPGKPGTRVPLVVKGRPWAAPKPLALQPDPR